MGMGQNPVPLVNIKIAGKWMFIPLKMVLIGIDPVPYMEHHGFSSVHIPTWPRIRRGLLCPAGPKPGPGPYEDGKGILLGINKDRTD